MDPVFFFIFGLTLVALAVGLSYLGIKGKATFPPTGQALKRMTLGVAVIVAATAVLAVSSASQEKKHRDEELAEEAAKEAEHGQAGQGEEGGGSGTELDLSSPADGSLVFTPAVLQAPAGVITLLYANPSPVPHSIAIADGGVTLDESPVFTESEGSVSGKLSRGEYVFLCTVPGHFESGMEGTLTVK